MTFGAAAGITGLLPQGARTGLSGGGVSAPVAVPGRVAEKRGLKNVLIACVRFLKRRVVTFVCAAGRQTAWVVHATADDVVEGEDDLMSAAEHIQIPDKLFYRINEVATLTGVKPYVLRYWETEFPALAPEKDDNDQRRYRKADIELVLQIKRLLYDEKYTIAGARKQLKGSRDSGQPRANSSAHGVRPDSHRYRRINTSLSELRRDLCELYKIMA